MIKITDASGKVLYKVEDEATEPTPTPEFLASIEDEKEEEVENKEKKD